MINSILSTPIQLLSPRLVEFGSGTAAAVGRFVRDNGFTRTLVVADAFNATRIACLELPGAVSVFAAIKQEPDVADLQALIAAAEAAAAEVVVGFGGGSAMDMAKLAAVLPGSGQSIFDVTGVEKVRGKRAALVQVPTTSGTGSEAGTRALITDPETRNKLAVQSNHMLADLAVIDPDLTLTVPTAVTAATGVDALAHCVEAFTNRRAHPAIDLYAVEGMRLIGRWLPRAIADGSDREARAALSLASYYGGVCLGPVNTAGGHAIAYPLGSRHHVPHGAANALIFPHVLAFNAPAVAERTAIVMGALGLPMSVAPEPVFEAAYRWCSDNALRMRMSDYGIPEDDLPAMADEAFAIRRLLDNNPRNVARQDILAMYHAAF